MMICVDEGMSGSARWVSAWGRKRVIHCESNRTSSVTKQGQHDRAAPFCSTNLLVRRFPRRAVEPACRVGVLDVAGQDGLALVRGPAVFARLSRSRFRPVPPLDAA